MICSYYFVIVSWGAYYLYEAVVALCTRKNLPWHDPNEQITYAKEVEEAFVKHSSKR